MSVIIKPVITEKLSRLQEEGKYTFEVVKNASKPEIKEAVEATYPGVKVAKVNTLIMPSKPKGRYTRSGYQGGRTKVWKKAIVTVKEGEIDFFAEI
ncbi:MAG: 50S ribosomal protein L23 [Balneola sp.]|jgi:large subunit ribosomal protein L23|nr:50S ribosomal protein L23 [Balneola sp.]MBE80876.1 50S ribosomal protein L23 [Balneola sp.]|tara:strand:+ start:1061 stop:1348 length:288 start_codon:yes stop_codon:yes gene_type:complete